MMNSDIIYLEENIDNYEDKISGPWRLTKWTKDGSPPSYIFSEEHENEGSCPDKKEITQLLKEIIDETDDVHVFIEHFTYGNDIVNTYKNIEEACTIKSDNSILNNLRTCLEVLRIKQSDKKDNIHFVDPRTDMVAILPGGGVYNSVKFYTKNLLDKNDKDGALVVLYEAYIHPLQSLFPDTLVPCGRLSGSIKHAKELMTNEQVQIFNTIWKRDVIDRIAKLTSEFRRMQTNLDVTLDTIENLYILYRDMTNKFLDTWLLSHLFIAQNKNMSASVIYLGSLHSLNFEKYMESYGYQKKYTSENKNLNSCLQIKRI